MSSTKLALEQAEAEKRRRLVEKVEKGEAIRLLPVVVGHPCRAEAEKQRKIAALRAAGEKREIIFGEQPTEDGSAPISVICTGVPRPHRDGEARCENCSCASSEPRYDPRAYQRELEKRRREFDVVMAWSVDRLGRGLQDLVGFLSELHALAALASVSVVCVSRSSKL